MNKFLVLILLFIVGVSCSTQKKANKEVQKEAQAVTPSVDAETQIQKAIASIRKSSDLNADQKDKLVQVVNQYAERSKEIKLQQSQYRAVLVNEMLNTGSKKNPKVDAAKKKLVKLDKKNSKLLGKFIRDFKHHSGNLPSRTYQPFIRETLSF